MATSSPVVREFFEQYELSRNTFDLGLIDSQYPDSFMFAGPNGDGLLRSRRLLQGSPKGRSCSKRSVIARQSLFRSMKQGWTNTTSWCGHSSYGALKRRVHRSTSTSTPPSSCISRMVRPELSFSMSTKTSNRRCEREAW